MQVLTEVQMDLPPASPEEGEIILGMSNQIPRRAMGLFEAKNQTSSVLGFLMPVEAYNSNSGEVGSGRALVILKMKTPKPEDRSAGHAKELAKETIRAMGNVMMQIVRKETSPFPMSSWLRPINISKCMSLGLNSVMSCDPNENFRVIERRNKALFPRFAGAPIMNLITPEVIDEVYDKYLAISKKFLIRFIPSLAQWRQLFAPRSAIFGFYTASSILLVELVEIVISGQISRCATILLYLANDSGNAETVGRSIVETIAHNAPSINFISCYESASLTDTILEAALFRRTECDEFLHIKGLDTDITPGDFSEICVPLF
jgi:hypothetical protein